MQKRLFVLLIPITSIFFLSLLWSQVSAVAPQSSTQAANDPFAEPQPIYTKNASSKSLLNTTIQMVFGPSGCTSLGDPYSPFNSVFRPTGYPPGPYTYHYRILIPPDYSDDVLRVELFDPDSSNAATNNFTVTRTNFAVTNGLPATANKSCPDSNRMRACMIDTDEGTLINPPGVIVDDLNIFWFGRVDENYRPTPSCDQSGGYNVSNNTTTLYQLSYLAEVATGTVQVPLVGYTGRLDNVDDTDLRWVAPGAPLSVDQTIPVPTNFDNTASGDGFEISLTVDTPNMYVEPMTGDRYLYLSVTTISGSSQNGFDIWAGSPDAVGTVPSEVNARNLAILNGFGDVYADAGLDILAQESAPQTIYYTEPFTRRLRYFGPAYSGQPITLTLFDIDGGSSAPLSLGIAGFTYTYGIAGTTDPDGVPADSRCFPNCNNQFIAPSYVITLPGDINCNIGNPFCTPFSGGFLEMSYASGSGDKHLVSLTAPPEPYYAPEEGCTGFPIAIHQDSYSVYPPGTGSGNDYPDPGDFHPSSPQPLYSDFPSNVPNTLLLNAQEGYVYKLPVSSSSGGLSWLVWNDGILDSVSTLVNSMTWPGNVKDYMDHGDGGVPATPLYPYVVRGYVNPFDTSDLALYVGDRVSVHSGVFNTLAMRNIVNEHINNGRILRLPIWNGTPINSGGHTYLQVLGFANFRLQGWYFGQPESWLLLEFVGWDFACLQNGGPTHVRLNNPTAVASKPSLVWLLVLVLLGLNTAVFLAIAPKRKTFQPD